MASTYNDKTDQNSTNTSTSLASSISGKVSGTTTGSGTSNSSAISRAANGNSYINQVNDAMNSNALKFDASQNSSVVAAQDYLNSVIASKPGSYQSKYTSQLNDLYDQLMNRGSFTYDMNGDALYDQYRQRYTAQGQKSMRDTMGQAAANTGGYGNSYAQTAGQDAYNNYMAQLQNTIPELQSQARQRFDDQTTQMQNRYNLVQQADESDYNRYRNDVTDWQNERSYAADAENTAYNRAYSEYSDGVSMAMTAAGNERQDAANEKSSAQNLVATMISAGAKPSKDLLTAAGYSDADVKALLKKKG